MVRRHVLKTYAACDGLPERASVCPQRTLSALNKGIGYPRLPFANGPGTGSGGREQRVRCEA
jgi:hypothetical protein